ncbi:MAG: riboflavin synthase subunit beta [Flavobacteriales bacterium]
MGFIKRRKNKKFSYTPRYYDDKGKGSPYKINHTFDEFRTTVGNNKGLKGKFFAVLEDLKSSKNKKSNKTILLIVTVLILFFLYIIDFDLSIFNFRF